MRNLTLALFLVCAMFPLNGAFAGQLEDRIGALEALVSAQQAQINTLQATVNDQQARLAGIEDNPAVVAGSSGYMRVDMNTINGVVGPHILFEGVNIHVRSGSGTTSDGFFGGYGITPSYTGLGNIIIGYNETPESENQYFEPLQLGDRKGSHNLVIGKANRFPSYSGLVHGFNNRIRDGLSHDVAIIAGGGNDAKSTYGAVVGSVDSRLNNAYVGVIVGGNANLIETGTYHSSIVGGSNNRVTANGYSVIIGGNNNSTSGMMNTVSGGINNQAAGSYSTVTGGQTNLATGYASSVSGGINRQALGDHDWAAGSLWENY